MTETHVNLPSLHTQNPLGRFSDRAEDYAKYRPTYPAEAIDLILQGLEEPTQLVVADIGAGTGISSRLIADRGANVWAIEPNPAMRQAITPHPLVEFRDGIAEQTGLLDQSVDLVLCCQSFHWFDKPVALAEFHRILKPSGRVALMWNNRNAEDQFTQDYSDVIGKVADRTVFDRKGDTTSNPLADSLLFANSRSHILFQTYRLNQDSLIGLALSTSYIPKQENVCEHLIADLQMLYQNWINPAAGDFVTISYRVSLHLGDRSR
ncbi:MAG: class I SAM-dependent methyltransferase [Cyanobacteria bacterium CRU_2_1]|nr:class I SAM-dependent methyltransferase [Cyanobacteria bacterium RU_5_0]NJR60689.1 class I SAM-dependent methyltransferase [Cyanobacteria bacterium CRU_2_1]